LSQIVDPLLRPESQNLSRLSAQTICICSYTWCLVRPTSGNSNKFHIFQGITNDGRKVAIKKANSPDHHAKMLNEETQYLKLRQLKNESDQSSPFVQLEGVTHARELVFEYYQNGYVTLSPPSPPPEGLPCWVLVVLSFPVSFLSLGLQVGLKGHCFNFCLGMLLVSCLNENQIQDGNLNVQKPYVQQ
jgi:hypothetical protein